MNTGTFAGYLGGDATLRKAGDYDVANFSLGVKVGRGDRRKTLWVACAIWGDRGVNISQYLTKGMPVSVSGEVDIHTYENREGKTVAELTLNVQGLTLLGKSNGNGDGGHRNGNGNGQRNGGRQRSQESSRPKDEFDDDIPFN